MQPLSFQDLFLRSFFFRALFFFERNEGSFVVNHGHTGGICILFIIIIIIIMRRGTTTTHFLVHQRAVLPSQRHPHAAQPAPAPRRGHRERIVHTGASGTSALHTGEQQHGAGAARGGRARGVRGAGGAAHLWGQWHAIPVGKRVECGGGSGVDVE